MSDNNLNDLVFKNSNIFKITYGNYSVKENDSISIKREKTLIGVTVTEKDKEATFHLNDIEALSLIENLSKIIHEIVSELHGIP